MKPIYRIAVKEFTGPGVRPGGFTLIEVLIALSVLAVTMTAVFTMFSSGLRLRTVTRERMSFDRDARLFLSALSDDLANLVPAGPRPLVTSDSIVLWRVPGPMEPGVTGRGRPLLVTYQWSGSATQDSLLVRMTTAIETNIADSAAVHLEFLRWARNPIGMLTTRPPLFRDGKGDRFGQRASLNGLGGTWTAFPGVGDFRFEMPRDLTDLQEDPVPTRLVVHLRPVSLSVPWNTTEKLREDAWSKSQGRGVAMTYVVPGGLAVPVFITDLEQPEEAS
jgi:prepilin-type N-terminal cleavage/methylation domain-containing protein